MTIQENYAYTTDEVAQVIRRHRKTVCKYARKKEFGEHVYLSSGRLYILGKGILYFQKRHNLFNFKTSHINNINPI